jgi:transcriptional regulator with XRE-family HTH domain
MNKHRNRPKDPLDHEPAAVTYAREQAGLSKTRLAELCGVSLSLISEIESGTRNATPAMLNKIAHALNCPRVVLERKREGSGGESVRSAHRRAITGEGGHGVAGCVRPS